MTDFNKLVKQVSQELNEDKDLVEQICKYQFKFIKNVMQDPEDTHDILINKLIKFKLKTRYKNNKRLKYTTK